MQCSAPPPPSKPPCLSFSLLHNVQPDSLWRLVYRNGSSAKLCTMGISTFLFSHKITACCSILCYGRCVPMGWLVEQRMGESKPACSSKQVLHAFEDACLLRAKVGLEEEMCMLSDMHMHTHIHTHAQMIIKTFDQFDRQPAAWWHAHVIKEVLERQQIVCTLKMKVMRALFSKDIWSIIHCLCLQLVQWE